VQNNHLLRVKEASAEYGIHPDSLYKHKDEIGYIKRPGTLTLFPRKNIEKWLEAGYHDSDDLLSLLSDLSEYNFSLDNSFRKYEKVRLKRRTEAMNGEVRYKYPFGTVLERKTKNGEVTYYRDYQVNGQRVRTVIEGVRNRAEAVKVIMVEVADAKRGKYHFHKKNSSFSDFTELFYEKYSQPNKRSHKSTDAVYLKHMKEFFGDIRLTKITPLMIEDYKIHRLKTGKGRNKNERVSNRTVNAELSGLRKMFNKAIDWNYAVENPVDKVEFLSEKKSLRERVLSLEEQERLLAASPQWLRAILIVAIYTGIRKWKVLTLKWEHVDFEKEEILVVDPKDDEDRKIPMNHIVYNTLAELRLKSKQNVYVFTNPRTGTHYVEPKGAFTSSCEEAGIEDLTFHDLRHTFASRLVANGNDLNTVRVLMGHSKLTTTQRYLHSNAELKRDAVNSLAGQSYPVSLQRQKNDKQATIDFDEEMVTPSNAVS
jgi:integrase